VAGNPYSSAEEIHTSLRWIMLLAGKVDCDLAATTGIHDGRDVVKQLLAGATVTQLCSTIYNNGFVQINRILEQLSEWMAAHDFNSLAEFRGRLSQTASADQEGYQRLQYIKGLTGIE
jgi:dihydroorotate dehydrogenase (fumarate)